MVKRTLMQRNQELVDFESDPATGKVRIIDGASDGLAAPAGVSKIDSDVWRPAPILDYDSSFGFPFKGITISQLCENPLFTQFFCAHRFAFLDSSWDWSWYVPQALDGFEDRIVEAFAPNRNLPPVFAELIARLFVMQRDYVNEVASAK